ncbi:MAG: N-acetylglucosamine-6-phosphate deacetylase, partial [Planctomycetota bacterium]
MERAEPPARVLANALLVLPDRSIEGDLIIRGSAIAALAAPGKGDGAEIWDLDGRRVAPGRIDAHTHGGWGIDFYTDGAERLVEAAARFAEIGVTTLLPTLHAAPPEEMLDRIAEAARACAACPALHGIHLEGPFISADRRGALPEAGILPYDDRLMERILAAAAGSLRVLTFAPEVVPAAALRRIRSAGVRLSVGHTAAGSDVTRAAIREGAWRATHLPNAMAPIHHRGSGPVLPLLLDERVRVEVIADGVHVDDDFLRLVLALKGRKGVMAVSDSIPAAGLGATEGGFAGGVVTSDGRRAARGDGTLAGSVMFLPAALERLEGELGLTPWEIAALGSSTAAADLGLPRTGRIASGCRADL